MKRGLISRVLREASLFIVVEGAVQLAFLLYFAILALRFSVEEVGWYALMRRVLALAVPILSLGLAEGLAKYLAVFADSRQQRKLMCIAGVLLATTCIALLIAAVLAPQRMALIFFADERWSFIVLPFAVFAVGIVIHMFAYAYLRGTFRIRELSALQFLNLALLPILVLALATNLTLGGVLLLTGVAMAVTSTAVILAFFFRTARSTVEETGQVRGSAFLHFSLTRIPAMLLAAGLTSLVPILAQHHIPMQQVGFLAIAITLLIGLAGTIAPLGTVLLPHVSALWAQEGRERVSARVHLLIGASIQIFVFLSLQLILVADLVIEFWMGGAYVEGVGVIRIVLAAAVGYGFYSSTRTVLDAVSERPINTINGALAVFVVAGLALLVPYLPNWLDSAKLYAGCIFVGCSVLGLMTYRALREQFQSPTGVNEDLRHLLWGLGATAASLIVAAMLRPVAARGAVWLVGVEFGVGMIYLAVLWMAHFEWVRMFFSRWLPHRSS